jgi:N-succinyldiaminopimelate aminotransferase
VPAHDARASVTSAGGAAGATHGAHAPAPAGAIPAPAGRAAGAGETVFAHYARLAARTGSVNLGQGFPDDPPPKVVLDAFARAREGGHQYAPLPGLAALRAAVAAAESPRHGRPLDPDREVQVTVGATEGLFAALLALVGPHDEVVVVEPCYDAYPAMIRLAGGVPVGVAMDVDTDGRWSLDPARVAAAMSPRTRVLLLNDPHNPTGTVLPAPLVAALAAIARDAGVAIVVDDVYAHLAFAPTTALAPHAPERTLVVGSAGKTFGVTGWKVGWVTGPSDLVAAVRAVHQWVTFAVATPLQAAVADLMAAVGRGGDVDALLADQRTALRTRRDALADGLRAAGMAPSRADAGYFLFADVSDWPPAAPYGDDRSLCDALPTLAGVVAIPGSAFRLAPPADDRRWLRFAFCRGAATVDEGVRRLQAAARR